ncbi:hypothetical protein EIN_127800 [Entamoeba invadens IP1]|uniref:Acyltransferase 3 domain-containing protein n=1 Tax=Entamoeba invadens IP1 TaxID=370355 RepID=L7FPG3_ENTIV|nr:hypothetical protein EIN_127800 [Entamoeba invadens IP1]ELP91550.1 hypothetical protein EIN_127800 [Entamoeba invadens IP1]|eukprot:XP_004258321.1 hypothetical protein EIN_127800 [Entamoeba invadens IP1]
MNFIKLTMSTIDSDVINKKENVFENVQIELQNKTERVNKQSNSTSIENNITDTKLPLPNTPNQLEQQQDLNENTQPITKPFLTTVSFLRGISAVAIVFIHLNGPLPSTWRKKQFNHAYLAVDFFFLLSGYMTSYTVNPSKHFEPFSFLLKRIIRLQPMQVLSTLFGAFFFYLNNEKGDEFNLYKLICLTIVGCFTIPMPENFSVINFNGFAYPLNGPAWTVLYEYIAALLFTTVFRFLNVIALCVLNVFFLYFIIDIAFNIDTFRLINGLGGELVKGWTFSFSHCYIAFSRLLFSFTTGLIIEKIPKKHEIKFGFIITLVSITVLYNIPYIQNKWARSIFDLCSVVIVFPCILLIATRSKIHSQFVQRIGNFLGEISYSMYLTHSYILGMFNVWGNNYGKDASLSMWIYLYIVMVFVPMVFGYSCWKLFDVPVRNLLRKKKSSLDSEK